MPVYQLLGNPSGGLRQDDFQKNLEQFEQAGYADADWTVTSFDETKSQAEYAARSRESQRAGGLVFLRLSGTKSHRGIVGFGERLPMRPSDLRLGDLTDSGQRRLEARVRFWRLVPLTAPPLISREDMERFDLWENLKTRVSSGTEIEDLAQKLDACCLEVIGEKLKDLCTKPKRSTIATTFPDGASVSGMDVESRRIEREILNRSDIPKTERAALIKARLGQGRFREAVLKLEITCRVTGVADPTHLRASHIKPWRDSDDREKLDGENGLMLAPHVDHLFDKGLISFTDDGSLLVADDATRTALACWHIDPEMTTTALRPRQQHYMNWHRREIFRKASTTIIPSHL